MQMTKETDLTAMQACRRLGVTLDYVYRLLYAQRLPARKVNGIWRIPASAVEDRARRRGVKIAA